MDNEALDKIITDIVKEFKKLNGIDDSNNDEIFNIYCNKAITTILNLTNRIRFPEQLKYVVLDMMTDFYTEKFAKNMVILNESSASNNSIKEIEEGGRRVVYQDSKDSSLNTIMTLDINNQLNIRQKEINRYRLLYKEMRYDEQD